MSFPCRRHRILALYSKVNWEFLLPTTPIFVHDCPCLPCQQHAGTPFVFTPLGLGGGELVLLAPSPVPTKTSVLDADGDCHTVHFADPHEICIATEARFPLFPVKTRPLPSPFLKCGLVQRLPLRPDCTVQGDTIAHLLQPFRGWSYFSAPPPWQPPFPVQPSWAGGDSRWIFEFF